jgi:hypothetical protein
LIKEFSNEPTGTIAFGLPNKGIQSCRDHLFVYFSLSINNIFRMNLQAYLHLYLLHTTINQIENNNSTE